MARHRYTQRAPAADAATADRHGALPASGDWRADWDVPGTGGVRLEPCDPIEVYAHDATRPAAARDVPTFLTRGAPRRARWRGVVSLMWAGVLTLAALQHAGEVERRANAREPSAAEIAMQMRPTRQIHAAWRDIGQSAGVEPVVAQAAAGASAGQAGEAERQDAPAEVRQADADTPSTAATDPAAAQKVEVQAEAKAETETPQKPQVPEVAIAVAAREAAAETRESKKPKVEAALIRPASGPAEPIAADARSESPPAQEEAPRTTAAAKLSANAEPAEATAATQPRVRARMRQPRALSAPATVGSVFVAPGEFVAKRYFSVYGLAGRAP